MGLLSEISQQLTTVEWPLFRWHFGPDFPEISQNALKLQTFFGFYFSIFMFAKTGSPFGASKSVVAVMETCEFAIGWQSFIGGGDLRENINEGLIHQNWPGHVPHFPVYLCAVITGSCRWPSLCLCWFWSSSSSVERHTEFFVLFQKKSYQAVHG